MELTRKDSQILALVTGTPAAEAHKIITTRLSRNQGYHVSLGQIEALARKADKGGDKATATQVRSFLADRAYTAQGILVSRNQPGSVIKDHQAVAERVTRMLRDGVVDAIDGTVIPMPAESILIHSDTAGAVELATTIKDSVAAAGYTVRPYAD